MPEKGIHHDYDLRSNLAVPSGHRCLVCDSELRGNTRWMDLFGEAVCITCETPYQLLRPSGMSEDIELPKCNIKEEWIAHLREYWEETQQPMGLGTILIARDYSEDLEHRWAFDRWLREKGYLND